MVEIGGDLPALDVRPLQEGHAVRGIGRYVSTLAGSLPFPAFVAWRGVPLPAGLESSAVLYVDGSPTSGRVGWARDALRRRPPDRRLHLPVADARLARPLPQFVTAFDAIPWRFPDDYPAGRIGAVRRRLDTELARRAPVVLTASHASAEDLVRFLRVPERKIRIVTLAAGPPWPEPSPGSGRRSPEVMRSNRRYLVAAGGFTHADPRKRLGDLLEVLTLLPDDIGLVVTGADGPAKAAYCQRAEELGVRDRLELTGQLPSEQLIELYSGAAAFAFPSAWEGFGLPLVEAMSVGLPCVVSQGGALAEIAGSGATVVPVGDPSSMAEAIKDLITSSDRATRASRAATSRVAAFTVERVRETHVKAYEGR